MRILLSSVGRRGYLVRYFKEAIGSDGQVWGVDSSPYAPGFAYCDKREILPGVNDLTYCEKLLSLCKNNHIDIVIPLIDPELEVLAAKRDVFHQNGIMVVVSPMQTIAMAFDKYRTWEFAQQHGIAMPRSVLTVQEALDDIQEGRLRWPLVVKPRKGSASFDITYCSDEVQLCGAYDGCADPMIQQYAEGPEYGFDLFGDQHCRPVSVYCKKKLAMRAGETDKAVTTSNSVMIEFGSRLLAAMNLYGPADADVILTSGGPQLLEINPRFGGGYPCSHLAGADFCSKLIAMREGKSLKSDIGVCPEGVYMLKQDEIIRPDWNGMKG